MRYALLSDIHGNLHALRAVLSAVDRAGVDAVLCAGDVVGYGPQPDECVALLAQRGVTTVAGNHELMALGKLDRNACSPAGRETSEWTERVISRRTSSTIEGYPGCLQVDDVLVAHGSPEDPTEYVRSPDRADELLDGLTAPIDRLVLGHTHQAWLYSRAEGTVLRDETGTRRLAPDVRYLINPGSVGQTRHRLPRAWFALLDTDSRTVTVQAVRYDVRGVRRALRRRGRPVHACHWRASWRQRLRWSTGALVRRLGASRRGTR